jgi:hypothetical protein
VDKQKQINQKISRVTGPPPTKWNDGGQPSLPHDSQQTTATPSALALHLFLYSTRFMCMLPQKLRALVIQPGLSLNLERETHCRFLTHCNNGWDNSVSLRERK